MRKICVITGTRAEYGLLSRLMRRIKDANQTSLQLVVTNMHLSKTYGNTCQEIEEDGFNIDCRVPIIDENGANDSCATVLEVSRALTGFADAYRKLNPDLIVVLGDRYEILAASIAALIMRLPVAHIAGGDVTEGAFDDAIRHSITKMSNLHFTSTEGSRKRVIQLGEQPDKVFNVGSLGVENIKKLKLFNKTEIEKEIDFEIDNNTILVTYHPVTLGKQSVKNDIENFIEALEERKDLRIIFTMPNSDTGSSFIINAINDFVCRNAKRSKAFKSLGVVRYLSVMRQVAAVVGNSSSGVVEVPSFGVPTLNIGDRQKGRVAAKSVWNCSSDKASILEGLEMVLSIKFREIARNVKNPYDNGDSSEKIFNVISTYSLNELRQKHFFDINFI